MRKGASQRHAPPGKRKPGHVTLATRVGGRVSNETAPSRRPRTRVTLWELERFSGVFFRAGAGFSPPRFVTHRCKSYSPVKKVLTRQKKNAPKVGEHGVAAVVSPRRWLTRHVVVRFSSLLCLVPAACRSSSLHGLQYSSSFRSGFLSAAVHLLTGTFSFRLLSSSASLCARRRAARS